MLGGRVCGWRWCRYGRMVVLVRSPFLPNPGYIPDRFMRYMLLCYMYEACGAIQGPYITGTGRRVRRARD